MDVYTAAPLARPLALMASIYDDDETPWLLLEFAHTIEPGPFRDTVTALADAFEELPATWRAWLACHLG